MEPLVVRFVAFVFSLRNIFLKGAAFIFLFSSTVLASPAVTTYQAKIIKPNGYPLEAGNVNFKFTILDPAGSCILYSETYSTVNMANTAGVISFSLGSGIKTYPVSATTFKDVFLNVTPSLSCDVSSPVTSYSPQADDVRKIVMQFNDGSGWQTLPAMAINAVPYAMYADQAQKLNGFSDSDFVKASTLVTCGTSEALRYNGAGFSCVAVGSSGAITSGDITTALGYTPAAGASVTALTSSLNTTDATLTSVSSTVFSVSSTVTSLSNTVAASFAAITSSQWSSVASGISYSGGNVGIGTTTPRGQLQVIKNGQTSITNSEYDATSNQYFLGDISGLSNGILNVQGKVRGILNLWSNYTAGSGTSLGTIKFPHAARSTTDENAANIAAITVGSTTGDSTTGGNLRFLTRLTSGNLTERMIISDSGNVGIGVASPQSLLVVKGANGITNTTVNGAVSAMLHLVDTNNDLGAGPQIAFSSAYSGASTITGAVIGSYKEVPTGSDSGQYNHSLIFKTSSYSEGPQEKMRLTSNGRIGVGTSSPTELLDVSGNVKATKFIGLINSPDTRDFVDAPETVASAGVAFDFKRNTTNGLSDGGTYNGVMTFRPYGASTDWSGGPSHQLGFTQNGNLYQRSGTSTSWGAWKKIINSTAVSGTVNYLPKFTSANGIGNSVIYESGGNVGIGTIAPEVNLHVENSTASANGIFRGGTSGAPQNAHLFFDNGDNSNRARIGRSVSGNLLGFRNAPSGNEHMVITTSGNVGIGTTAPAQKLDIQGGNLAVAFDDVSKGVALGATALGSEIKLNGQSTNHFSFLNSAGNLQIGKANANNILGQPVSAHVTVMGATGNVGIGTTSPQSKLNLPYVGSGNHNLLIGNTSDLGSNNFEIGVAMPSGNTHWPLGISVSGSRVFGVDATGNLKVDATGTSYLMGSVGIGTISPSAILEVRSGSGSLAKISGEGDGYAGGTMLQIKNDSTSSSNNYISLQADANGSPINFANFQYGGSNNLVISNSSGGGISLNGGNVGIGTSSAGEKLDVLGNMRIGGSDTGPNYIAFRGTSGDQPGTYSHTYIGERIHAAPEGSELLLFKGNDADNASGPDRIRMAAGNIVFDTFTSPDAISGSFEAVATAASLTTRMVIKSTGSVGIGTTAPSEKLHVVGNLRVQGSTDCTLGNGAGGTNCSSDVRLKENIKPIPYALDKVLSLKGVEFDWNQKSSSHGRHDIGVIAQDVEKVFPTAVINDESTGYKKVDYAVLVAPVIEALKELYNKFIGHEQEIERLQAKTLQLEKENKELRLRLERIERKLSSE